MSSKSLHQLLFNYSTFKVAGNLGGTGDLEGMRKARVSLTDDPSSLTSSHMTERRGIKLCEEIPKQTKSGHELCPELYLPVCLLLSRNGRTRHRQSVLCSYLGPETTVNLLHSLSTPKSPRFQLPGKKKSLCLANFGQRESRILVE